MTIWAWCLLDLLATILIDWIPWSFDKNRFDPKVIPSEAKKNMPIAKNISEFAPEGIAFGLEFGWIEETV